MLFRRKKSVQKKSAKIAAYEALIKYDVSRLPVPVEYDNCEIEIYTLQLLACYGKKKIREVYKIFGYRGFVTYDAKDDRYLIFANEEDPEPLLRWVISTAIGYIEAGHPGLRRGLPLSAESSYINDFVYTYTCPDCVLERDKIIEPDQIIRICDIPFRKAREKSKYLKLYLKADTREKLGIEEIICSLFKND